MRKDHESLSKSRQAYMRDLNPVPLVCKAEVLQNFVAYETKNTFVVSGHSFTGKYIPFVYDSYMFRLYIPKPSTD